MKTRALELGLPVHQPEKVKDDSFLELLRSYAPEVLVVVAYGRILPQAVLDLPQYGCINVHGSLLPAYRGAAPIQRAVFDGCAETGVTIMQMDIGMDTGDILMQGSLPITAEDNSGTMFDKLAALAVSCWWKHWNSYSRAKLCRRNRTRRQPLTRPKF